MSNIVQRVLERPGMTSAQFVEAYQQQSMQGYPYVDAYSAAINEVVKLAKQAGETAMDTLSRLFIYNCDFDLAREARMIENNTGYQ